MGGCNWHDVSNNLSTWNVHNSPRINHESASPSVYQPLAGYGSSGVSNIRSVFFNL